MRSRRFLLSVLLLLPALLLVSACAGPEETSGSPAEISTMPTTEEITDGTTVTPNEDSSLSVQEGSLSEQEDGSLSEEDGAEAESGFSFQGKILSILGDSISTFDGYNPPDYSIYYPYNDSEILNVEDTWWMQVLKSTGMRLGTNASYSGCEVTGDSTSTEDGRPACSFRRISDLRTPDGTDPDVIIIFTGINDFFLSVDLGEFEKPEPVAEGNILNFSDAYQLMLQKVLASYPDAVVYCCTFLETDNCDVKDPRSYPTTNKNGNVIDDFNDRVREIAEAYALTVIDVHECGITYDRLYEFTGDGTHPDVAGARLIAEYITEALLQEEAVR